MHIVKEDKESLAGFSIDEIKLKFDYLEVIFKHSFRTTIKIAQRPCPAVRQAQRHIWALYSISA